MLATNDALVIYYIRLTTVNSKCSSCANVVTQGEVTRNKLIVDNPIKIDG